jgi:hypothetical protein
MGSIAEQNQRTKISRYCPFKVNKGQQHEVVTKFRFADKIYTIRWQNFDSQRRG